MKFARDRPVENAFRNMGMIFELPFGYCRERITKLFKLISVMDDTYDVYRTMDELELSTTAIESWELNAMDQLPEYMKLFFLAVYNFTNELAYDILKEQGFHIIKYLKKLTRPASVQEHMENVWLSVAGSLVLVFAYVVVTNPITEAVAINSTSPKRSAAVNLPCRVKDCVRSSERSRSERTITLSLNIPIFPNAVSTLPLELKRRIQGDSWKVASNL
ncbi:hypothetical protein TIFTF001_039476 [Ficus carica]|uniref:Terpene synthase metal-binding domain-containing protein n=1 Tax=Ficus carica TaxID=3494 RepID=A0AA88E981_FICCA|nr:hypothetical protein TIFTF001_039476 [Ficus carica]